MALALSAGFHFPPAKAILIVDMSSRLAYLLSNEAMTEWEAGTLENKSIFVNWYIQVIRNIPVGPRDDMEFLLRLLLRCG